ncbi:MAG: hypothetical protein ACOYL6_13735 [Bacteriovoracaceae bacterium]
MKSTLIIAGLMVYSSLSFAHCLDRFCTGDTIIDKTDNIGIVTGFDKGNIQYKIGYSTYSNVPSYLSKKIDNPTFPAGKVVLDIRDNSGVVVNAFEDGRVNYKVGYSTFVSKDVSPEVVSLGEFKIDKKVLDKKENIGIVRHVFANGRIEYKVGYSTYFANDLSYEVDKLGSYQAEKVVLDKNDNVGVIQSVFNNGIASYKVGYSTFFSNQLAVEVKSHKSFQKDVLLIDALNNVGVVTYVFDNGRMEYKVGYTTYYKNADEVAAEIASIGAFKIGRNVIDANDNIGIVLHTFANKKVEYKVGYTTNFKEADLLSIEVLTHPQYSKTKLYAYQSRVGNPTKFFENGKVEFTSNYGIFVVTKLSEEVESFGRAQKGSAILTSFRDSGTILNLFDNGTVKANITFSQNGKKVEIDTSFKLLADLGQLKEQDKLQFLQELGDSFGQRFYAVGTVGILSDDLAQLKPILAQAFVGLDLNQTNYSKEQIKAIKEYLDVTSVVPAPTPGSPTAPTKPSEPTSGPIDETVLHVSLNNKFYESLVKSVLFGKKIKFLIDDQSASQTLKINVISEKKFLSTGCSLSMELKKGKYTATSSKTKRAIGHSNDACKKIMTKMLKEIL